MTFDQQDLRIRSGATLPHWEAPNALYFITFRLADSLPQQILLEIKAERQRLEQKKRQQNGSFSEEDKRSLNRLYLQRINRALDNGVGECYLKYPQVAEIVENALCQFDGDRYTLHAWCMMPNHVHLIMKLAPDQTLSRVMQSLKSFTATQANRQLSRTGPFWQREYYDHIIRNEHEYRRVVQYVLNNPAKAGLMDWPYVSDPSLAIGWR